MAKGPNKWGLSKREKKHIGPMIFHILKFFAYSYLILQLLNFHFPIYMQSKQPRSIFEILIFIVLLIFVPALYFLLDYLFVKDKKKWLENIKIRRKMWSKHDHGHG
tara:strand:+ start:197 stop:514 length:318 start_codon:yes stop_codon:yes gene_type:complete